MRIFLDFLKVLDRMSEWSELNLIVPDEELVIAIDGFKNEMKLWFDANKNNIKE